MTTASVNVWAVTDDGLIFTLEPIVAAIEEALRQAKYAYEFMKAAMTALKVVKEVRLKEVAA
jgi:hypothetical protein